MIVNSNCVDIRTLETPHTLCTLVTEVHAQKKNKTEENVHTNNPPKPAI